MKIGTNDIVDCKIGSTQVNKVYLGSNLVWELDTALDPTVQAFITANGITDTVYINALNTLVIYLKFNGVFTKIQSWWIFYGNATQSKYNLINPTLYELSYFGSGTIDNNGFLGNGTNAYANTNFTPSAVQNVNSNGLTLVCASNNTTSTGDVIEFGSFNSGSQISILVAKANNSNFRSSSALNDVGTIGIRDGVNDAKGVFTGTKTSAILNQLYINSALVSSGLGGGSLPTVPLYIMAMNLGGSLYGVSQQRLLHNMAHEGLNATEVAILHTGLNTFETALGRKTW